MSQHDRKRSQHPKGSVPPELKDGDLRWDDDADPSSLELSLGDEDAFDRVTAIPDIPNELLARRLMERADAEAGKTTKPSPGRLARSTPPPLTLELDHDLYDVDHDEQTVKVDQPELAESSAKVPSDPGPSLSFAFTSGFPHDSDLSPSELEELQDEPNAAPRSLPSDLPPALGGTLTERPAPEPAVSRASERPYPARTPAPPRTRMPTSELVLELDTQGPDSALELAESAPTLDHAPDSDLEFAVPLGTAPTAPPASTEQADMKDRYAMGDFTGALVIAEGILETNPGHEEALRCAERCREVLTQMYAARLGPLSQTVTVAIPNDEIRWLSLDHRAGFLLSLVDGSLTLEEILDISGMSKLDALRMMYTLFDQRVITLH